MANHYSANNKDGKHWVTDIPGELENLIDSRYSTERQAALINCEIAFQLKRIADILENFAINGVPVEKVP
jgi:hypothetical protein